MQLRSMSVCELAGDIADEIGAFLIYGVATELSAPVMVSGGRHHRHTLFRPNSGLAQRADLESAAENPVLSDSARAWIADVLAGEKPNHAIQNAEAWLSNMAEMIAAIGAAEEAGDDEAIEKAREAVTESPLSVLVRNAWFAPGSHAGDVEKYEILLSTGGPALRIVGDLGEYCTPDDNPRLEWQDWGTPWTAYPLNEAERVTVTTFARQFWFGE